MEKFTPFDNSELRKAVQEIDFSTGFHATHGHINTWDVSNMTDMSHVFYCGRSVWFGTGTGTDFNQPLDRWDVSNVTDMSWMFDGCSHFNQSLESWNVGNVKDMSGMFSGCSSLNQPLGSWDVGNVTIMGGMFARCTSFNQPLESWNVGNVKDMSRMFFGCTSFNQPLESWNVGNVKNMSRMFAGCSSFNQPLNIWNVGNVRFNEFMFGDCSSFDQPLDSWPFEPREQEQKMLAGEEAMLSSTMTVAELEAACHAHAQLEGCEHFLTIYDELTDEGLARANTSCGQVEFEELRRAFFTYYLTLVHDENPSGSIDEKNDRKRKRKGCEEGCEHSKETKAWLQSSQEA